LALFLVVDSRFGETSEKELNDVTQPIRAQLLKEKEHPDPMLSRGLNEVDADRVKMALPYWKQRSFGKMLEWIYRKQTGYTRHLALGSTTWAMLSSASSP